MIPQIEITSEQMDSLCSASFQLLQTMGNIYGSDPAYEMFEKLEEVLGPQVKANLFLKMLDSSYSMNMLTFTFAHGQCLNAINMIRSARSYAIDDKGNSLGLKEAKDIIDAARIGIGRLYFKDGNNRSAFIRELNAHGGKTV